MCREESMEVVKYGVYPRSLVYSLFYIVWGEGEGHHRGMGCDVQEGANRGERGGVREHTIR